MIVMIGGLSAGDQRHFPPKPQHASAFSFFLLFLFYFCVSATDTIFSHLLFQVTNIFRDGATVGKRGGISLKDAYELP